MTREEMIQRAQAVRSRDPFPPATAEALAALPAEQTELTLETAGRRIHLYELRPKAGLDAPCPMLINYHGGGYMKGRFDRDRVYCSDLAARLGALVWDVDYSLAPEHPFPTAVEEAYGAAAWAFAHAAELGVDPGQIFLLGHSAGGGLVAAVCQKAAAAGNGLVRPAAVLMEYFPADMAADPMSKLNAEQLADEREVRRAETARLYNQFYCSAEVGRDPLASPAFMDDAALAAFPDSLILSAGKDTLCEEDEELALRMARCGVNVTLRRFADSPHGFTINRMGEWQEALALHEAFLRAHLKGKRRQAL